MNKKITSFTDLIAWQRGHKLVIVIYEITKKFPKEERYCLIDQMRRAALSVTSNIAEGFGRKSPKEKLRFYYIAGGSLTELKNQIIVSRDVGYVNKADFEKVVKAANEAHRILHGFIRSTKLFISKSNS